MRDSENQRLKMRSRWSILIVDDELGVRESLRMLLKSHYDIHTAPGGAEALDILKRQKIHLITLDLNMPKLSGIETLREIRKVNGEIPVVIITGYGTRQEESDARLYGAKAFISKPFEISAIIAVIDEILGERRE